MTHISKTCMLILSLLVISSWVGPLQAGQNNHGFMTDGTHFIYNQVIGNAAIIDSTEGDITINGSLGQMISNIGIASCDPEAITQKAGFWFAVKGTEEKLLSFAQGEAIVAQEVDDEASEPIPIKLALNKDADPITVTISRSLHSDCSADDFTLYDGEDEITEDTFIVEFNGREYTNLVVVINNDRDLEGIEIIKFNIDDIEGDSSVKKGPFQEFVIKIAENDSWTINGSVKYLGSQTGQLNVEAIDSESGNPIVEADTYDWDTDTITKNFSTEIPPGTYTICSYIDSKGEQTEAANAWEVAGAYTFTVTIDEDGSALVNGADINLSEFSFDFAMYDPDDRFESQFIEYTGTYKAWIDTYTAVLNSADCGEPDEDFDKDGYTNFQEFLNGTDPTSADEPYAYNGYDPAFDEDAGDVPNKYQIITTNPLYPKARMGESFLVDVNYTTSDDNRGTTGLGLAIHFNSTFMEFTGWSNVLTDTMAGSFEDLTTAVKDEDDVDTPNDQFDDTDKVITIAWIPKANSEDRSWPGLEVPLPLRLCTLKFSVKSEAQGITYGDTTVIRFSATSKDTRYTFYGSPTTVEMNPFSFDVDGNGKANALTDGLLIMRYLFGLIIYNTNLQEDAVAADAIRTSSADIWTYLNNGLEMLDIDRNGEPDALTDGLLIMRYMFGFTEGDALIENAIAPGAPNDTDEKVIPYIKHYLPQKGSTVITPTTD